MSDVDRIAGWLTKRACVKSAASFSPLGRFLGRCKNMTLRECLRGHVQRGDYGECLAIDHVIPQTLALPSQENAEEAFLSELRLLFGIGSAREEQLRQEGYTTIRALLDHPRWAKVAQTLLQDWDQPLNPDRVQTALSHWLPASHPLCQQLVGLVRQEEILFFDLETLGLGGTPIVLAALARLTQADVRITQYLAGSLDEEIALLEQIDREMTDTSLLISYNGKSFDWPYLRERIAYYGLPLYQEATCHIDLLPHARRAFQDCLPDMRLETVETLLGVKREEDLPSEAVCRNAA